MSEYRLEVRGVTKVFPGTRALDQVQLQVRPGEVHALCGENGAGKSTLMNIIGGPCFIILLRREAQRVGG